VNAAVRGLPAIKMMWTGHAGKHMQSTVGRRFQNWTMNIPQPLTLRIILYNLRTLDDSFFVGKTGHVIHALMAYVHCVSIM
jgi:hypothetical protein